MLLLDIAIVIVLPCLFLTALIQLESYHTARIPIVLMALAWGIISFMLSRRAEVVIDVVFDADRFTITTLIAPFVEEGFKSVALIVMYAFVLVRYSGDAMIYGAAVGAGFAIAENTVYLILSPLLIGLETGAVTVTDTEVIMTGTITNLDILGFTLSRVAATGLLHIAIAAVIATMASTIVHYRRGHALRVTVTLIALAMVIHAMYNLALWLEDDSIQLIASLIVSGISLTGLVALMNFNVQHEYNQIVKELHYDPMRVIEHATLATGEKVNLLDHIRQQYGKKQMKLAESYLVKQGQIAVYVEHLDNGDLRETAIRALQRAIDADRVRGRRIFDRMEPGVQRILRQTNLMDAVSLDRLGQYSLRQENTTPHDLE